MNLAEYIDAHRDQHLAELCEFLRIPSVSAKSEHKPDIERGANWVAGNLRAAGFKHVDRHLCSPQPARVRAGPRF